MPISLVRFNAHVNYSPLNRWAGLTLIHKIIYLLEKSHFDMDHIIVHLKILEMMLINCSLRLRFEDSGGFLLLF